MNTRMVASIIIQGIITSAVAAQSPSVNKHIVNGEFSIPKAEDCEVRYFIARTLYKITERIAVENFEHNGDTHIVISTNELNDLKKVMIIGKDVSCLWYTNDLELMLTTAERSVACLKEYRRAVAKVDGISISTESYKHFKPGTIDIPSSSSIEFTPEGLVKAAMMAAFEYVAQYVLEQGFDYADTKIAEYRSEKEQLRLKDEGYRAAKDDFEIAKARLLTAQQDVMSRLALQNRWGKAEYESGLSQKDIVILRTHIASKALSETLKIQADTHYRDPFAQLRYAYVEKRIGRYPLPCDAQIVELNILAERCLLATKYIPDFNKFNIYNAACYAAAGDIYNYAATIRAVHEKRGRFSSKVERPEAALAVAAWRTAIHMSSTDSSEFKMRFAIALAMNGQQKEATNIMNSIRSKRIEIKCSTFAYCYPAILSAESHDDDALNEVKQFKSLGMINSGHWKFMRTDPDFALIRDRLDILSR